MTEAVKLLVKSNLEFLIARARTNPYALEKATGVPQPTIHRILTGESTDPRTKTLQPIADFFRVSVADLRDKDLSLFLESAALAPRRRAADFDLALAGETDVAVGEIEYWEARGSCGGGFLNHEELPKGHLIKEKTFFNKYGLVPENAFALYADGDSMADFIVDGDIVIFDKSKTHPRSGKIFAIEHPDGLRIKCLRRSIDGSWILESRNSDKRMYPDEVIPPDQVDLLKILGEFVYRQGG